MTDLLKLIGLDNAAEEKKAELSTKSVEKQRELSPQRTYELDYQNMDDPGFAAKYGGDAAFDRALARNTARREEQQGKAGRFAEELIADGALKVAELGSSIKDGVGAALLKAGSVAGGGNPLFDTLADAMLKDGTSLKKNLDKLDSDTTRVNENIVDRANAADELLHLQAAQDRIADGVNPLAANTVRVVSDVGTGAGNLLDNPTVLANEVMGQAPLLFMGPAARAAVSADAVAARATVKQAAAVAGEQAAGNSGRAAASELAKREFMREAADHFASRNLTAGVTATETASTYGDTAGQILDTPYDVLAQQYPEYADRLKDPQQANAARTEIAHKAAAIAAAITAPIAGLTSRLTANFELDPVHGGANPVGLLKNAGLEAGEEFFQSGGEATAGNLGQMLAGNEVIDPLDGVGTAAGQGAAAAAAGAGAMQAPGVAMDVTSKGLSMAADGAVKIGQAFLDRAEGVRADIEAKTNQQRAEQAAKVVEAVEPLSAALRSAPEANPLTNPVESDPILDPETKAALGPMDRVQGLAQTMGAIATNQVPEGKQNHFILSAARNIRELRRSHTQGANPELDGMIDSLIGSPLAAAIEQQIADIKPDDLAAMFAELGDPEVGEQRQEMAREVAYSAPDKMTAQQADEAEMQLYQRGVLTDEDKTQFSLVRELDSIAQDHKARMAQVEESTGYKSTDVVRDEITDKGFGKLKSVAQHVSSITRAAVSGDVAIAKLGMQQLQHFANHMARKASEFDAAATQQNLDGLPNKRYDVNFKTLDEDGRLTNKVKAFVNVHHEKGRGLIDAIFTDARTVTQAYNLLAATYPQLIDQSATDETPLAREITPPDAPTWAKAKKETTNAPAAVPAPAPVERTDAAPRAEAPRAEAAAPVAPAAEHGAESTAARAPASDERSEADSPVDHDLKEAARAQARAAVEEEERQRAFEREVALAEAARDGIEAEGQFSFNKTELASDEDIDSVLAMSEEEYLDAVTADNEATSEDAQAGLLQEVGGENELPSGTTQLRDLGNGITLHAIGNHLYAAEGTKLVGKLAVNTSGSTFAVDPAHQGKGIGKAMMRELLVRDPLHPSGGLSDAARRTRLGVLRDLRNEREAARAPTTVGERFPGLVESRGEGYAGQNKLLSSFQLDQKSRSFQTRFPNPIAKLQEVIMAAWNARNPAMLKELFTEDQQFLNVTGPQLQALGQLLAAFAPQVVGQLNATLQAASKTVNFTDFVAGKPTWNYENRLSLHATQIVDGQIEYQPEIAQGMALAALHWAMQMINMPVPFNKEKLDALYPSGMSTELEAAYRTMHFHESYTKALAREIGQMLGIKPNNNASQSWTTGVPFALAQEAINAMAALGMLEIHEVDTGTPVLSGGQEQFRKDGSRIEKTVSFLKFNKMGFDEARREGKISLQSVRDKLEAPQLLTRMFYPDAATLPAIGTAPTQVDTRMDGSGQKLSTDQREALRKQGNIPHTLNMVLIDGLQRLGMKNVLKLRGFDERGNDENASQLNTVHRRAVQGKNRGLVAGWNNLQELVNHIGLYAVTHDLNLLDVPVYYAARMIGNGRIMLNATFNPQSNKLAREAVSAIRKVLDLSDWRQHEEYLLTIAQALGVKTERKTNAEAAKEIKQTLSGERHKLLFATLNELMAADEDATQDIGDEATTLIQELFGDVVTDRAIHALFNYARYLQDPKATKFETYLAFEHDGVTNGPVNAMIHLGLWALDANLFEKLRQGGLIIGDAKTTLNEWGSKLGDWYRNTGATLQGKLIAKVKDKNITGFHRKRLEASIQLLARAGHVELADDDLTSLEVTRAPGKLALMPTIYGSSGNAMVRTLSGAIIDNVYAEISKAMAERRAIPVELQRQLGLMMHSYRDKTGEWVKTPALDLSQFHKYENFSFDPLHIRALVDNMMMSAGKDLTNAVEAEVKPVLSTFNHLYTVSALQVFQLRKAFEAKRAEKRAELVAAGKLGPNDALSRNDEQAILAELKDIAPVYHLLHNEEGSGREYGINIAERGQGEHIITDSKGNSRPQLARSISGGTLSLGITSTAIAEAGVRIAALLVQALGDATMMTQLVGNNPNGTLAVFDGWETAPGTLKERGLEANTAVLDSWKYDGLGAVVKSIATLKLDVDALTQPEVDALVKALRIKQDDLEAHLELEEGQIPTKADFAKAKRPAIAAHMQNAIRTLEHRAEMSRLYKDAIFGGAGVQSAIDQMAGAMAPVVIEGEVLSPELALERIQLHVANALTPAPTVEPAAPVEAGTAANDSTPNVEGRDPYLVQALKLNERGIAFLNKFELQALLSRYPFKNKLAKFVVAQIDHLLPEDLQVVVGDRAMIRRQIAERFPDANLAYDNNTGGVYYRNTLFLTNVAGETLVHELVHATTYALVKRFYQGAKGLTAHQREAIRALEVLAREFATKDLGDHPTVENAQNEVASYLLDNNVAEAVQEFLAWTLTNQHVADVLAKAPPSNKVKALAQKVLKLVRKVLGLPNNEHMDSFLSQTVGQFHRLARTGATQKIDLDTFALYQSLPVDASATHLAWVEDLIEKFNHVLTPATETERGLTGLEKQSAAFFSAVDLRNAFLKAGFNMTKREQHAFILIQQAFAAGLQMDSSSLTAMQHLHDAAMAELTYEDFLDDPADTSQPAEAAARERFNALLDLRTPDLQGKSNLLANFMAMALVHKPLRDRLTTLQMPVDKVSTDSADAVLRSGAEKVLNWVSNASVHVAAAPNQRRALDVLTEQLVDARRNLAAEVRGEPNIFQQAEAWVRAQQHSLALYIDGVRETRLTKQNRGAIDGWIDGILAGVHGLVDDVAAGELGEAILSGINEKRERIPKAVRELIAEFVGVTDSNSQLTALLNKSKHLVARARQRLRDEVPGEIRRLFSTELSKGTWEFLHTAVGKTDLQILLGTFSGDQLATMLRDPKALAAAIATIEGKLSSTYVAPWRQGAMHLAQYMMGKGNRDIMLARNAFSLARLAGRGIPVDEKTAKRAEPFLDRLVTLYALSELSQEEQVRLADLLSTEKAGMEGLLRVMRSLVARETNKPNALEMKYNRWKGYVPESTDPRTDLVLAGPVKGAELLKMGYTLEAGYAGDSADTLNGLAYYSITRAGGRSTYNQGAMQTIEGTVSGVDAITGRTLDASVKTYIDFPPTVAAILRMKKHQRAGGAGQNLLPVFNHKGEVIGFERTLDRTLLQKHLRMNRDLSKAVGMWMGRQAEEELADEVNNALVDVLLKSWEEGKLENREDEFVDVSKSKDKTIADAWGAIPREIQRKLKESFDGPVMVRAEQVNNAIGYRTASVADVFTGMSALPEEVRKGLETAAYGIMGKHAYRLLVSGERTWQSLVGSAKDWIVVRSGVVALANAVANCFQLMQAGVNPLKIPMLIAKKALETKEYLRNEKRLAQIVLDRETFASVAKKRELDREMQMLHDANRRLSIWPMIEAGELPSVAEGLTEQDDYSILADATKWVEDQLQNLPKGVTTAAKYAYIAKDTALYQGLNRMIQFGDFTAKAVLFDHLVAQGKSSQEAQRHVNETFVNYNLLPGRGRDYLEAMGMTWFLNYKIRIQKIILRTMRENPLRFFAGAAGAAVAGADSLVTSSLPATNLEYSLGPGQFFRAHDMLAWNQLFR